MEGKQGSGGGDRTERADAAAAFLRVYSGGREPEESHSAGADGEKASGVQCLLGYLSRASFQ